ncbi:MAG: TrkA family potassium uptake protein [Clostridiales bacterium]|nr:TrkA family potassium uptake protein [Clostridiales bacterium]
MGKSVAVLGLGRFGRFVTDELINLGADILVADSDQTAVEHYADKVSYAVKVDLFSADALSELGLENMDVVIVAMGSSLDASIMCVMVSKEKGVPKVIAKSSDSRMGEILLKVGADEIIYPEKESAARVAGKVVSESFLDLLNVDDDLTVVKMTPFSSWVGKSIREVDFRKRYKVNVIAVKEPGKRREPLTPDTVIKENFRMLMVGEKEDVDKLISG